MQVKMVSAEVPTAGTARTARLFAMMDVPLIIRWAARCPVALDAKCVRAQQMYTPAVTTVR